MSNLKRDWQRFCWELAKTPGVCTAGSRKILRGVQWSVPALDQSLQLSNMGYNEERGIKLRQLEHYYLNPESIDRAVSDYNDRMSTGGYGSVGISTHGNTKEGYTKQGFCIQAFTLTHLPKRETEVDIFYRTTEVVKKFGADLIFFRDRVLPHFELDNAPVTKINFHLANVSVHPMFFSLLLLSDTRFVKRLEVLEKTDPRLHLSVVKWAIRCIRDRETAAFKQARRVGIALEKHLGTLEVEALQKALEKKL